MHSFEPISLQEELEVELPGPVVWDMVAVFGKESTAQLIYLEKVPYNGVVGTRGTELRIVSSSLQRPYISYRARFFLSLLW